MRFRLEVEDDGIISGDKIQRLEGLTRSIVYGDAAWAAAGKARDAIRARAPVRTGKLRLSIKRRRIKWPYKTLDGGFRRVNNGSAQTYGGARGSGAAYGVPVEYGSAKRNIPPNPFFSDGVRASESAAFAAAQRAAAISFDKVANRIGSTRAVNRIERLSVE